MSDIVVVGAAKGILHDLYFGTVPRNRNYSVTMVHMTCSILRNLI